MAYYELLKQLRLHWIHKSYIIILSSNLCLKHVMFKNFGSRLEVALFWYFQGE